MVAKNWNKASFKVQFSNFVTKPEELGAINMCYSPVAKLG